MKQTLFLIPFFFPLFLNSFAQKENFFRFPTENNIINDICFSKNGNVICIADNKSIKVFSTKSHELLGNYVNGHTSQILSIDISRDSSYLVSGGKDSTVVIWDVKQEKLLKSIKCDGIISSVCVSPDNRYMAFGGTDKKVTVYNLPKGEMSYVISDHFKEITCITFSPDSRYVAISGGDKKIHIYENNTLKTTLSDHKGWVRDISFNPDGTGLISCDDNGITIVWNISNITDPKILDKSRFGFEWLLSVDFNQDGKTYAIGNVKGNVKIVGRYGGYKINVKSPINRLLFKPGNGIYLDIAVATRGKGVLFIKGKQMKPTH